MILLLLAAASDPAALMLSARARLSAPCEAPACVAPRRSAYRIDTETETGVSAKDRAIRDDGSKCNVVGARRCTKRGRTIFSTDFAR